MKVRIDSNRDSNGFVLKADCIPSALGLQKYKKNRDAMHNHRSLGHMNDIQTRATAKIMGTILIEI